jgi:hypothetical protein
VKRKIFVLILTLVFVISQVGIVDAKGFSRSFGGSKSFSKSFGGSKSFSKSFGGFSGSSKSSKGLFSKGSSSSTTKSSGGYSSSSSSRSVPGSYSSSSSAKRSSSAASSKKSAYMQDAYKKQSSSSNYSNYKQKLNAEQQKVYDSSMNSNFKVNNRMNFEDAMRTRTQRISYINTRPIYVNVRPGLFGGPLTWGMGYVGIWDMFFLMHASNLFWYHHWNEIYPYRDNFEETKFKEMEARVKQLEQQNNGVRDANYLDPGVDPDLQFSSQYQEKNLDNIYYSNKYAEPSTNPGLSIIIIIIIGAVLLIVVSRVSKPRKRKTYNSRIY